MSEYSNSTSGSHVNKMTGLSFELRRIIIIFFEKKSVHPEPDYHYSSARFVVLGNAKLTNYSYLIIVSLVIPFARSLLNVEILTVR